MIYKLSLNYHFHSQKEMETLIINLHCHKLTNCEFDQV